MTWSVRSRFITPSAKNSCPRIGVRRPQAGIFLIAQQRTGVQSRRIPRAAQADAGPRLQVGNPGYKIRKSAVIEGVEYLGPQPQERIHKEVRSALCTFFPNFVLPETFGLVFAESKAVGTPVLTCDAGAAAEIVGDPQQVIPVTFGQRAYENTFHSLSPAGGVGRPDSPTASDCSMPTSSASARGVREPGRRPPRSAFPPHGGCGSLARDVGDPVKLLLVVRWSAVMQPEPLEASLDRAQTSACVSSQYPTADLPTGTADTSARSLIVRPRQSQHCPAIVPAGVPVRKPVRVL